MVFSAWFTDFSSSDLGGLVFLAKFFLGFERFFGEKFSKSSEKFLHLLGVWFERFLWEISLGGGVSWVIISNSKVFMFLGGRLRDFLELHAKPLCFTRVRVVPVLTNSCKL